MSSCWSFLERQLQTKQEKRLPLRITEDAERHRTESSLAVHGYVAMFPGSEMLSHPNIAMILVMKYETETGRGQSIQT